MALVRGLFAVVGAVTALSLAGCSNSAQSPESRSASNNSAQPEPESGSPKLLRLMSSDQYVNTLVHIFGNDMRMETNFAPLPRTDGLLEVGASRAGVTSGQLEQYQRIAGAVAARAVDQAHREFVIGCKPADPKAADAACAAKFLASAGRLLYRRPLPDALLQETVAAAGEGATRLKDFYSGLGIALEGMLISPRVLYISDKSEPDPQNPGKERLDAYSLASRLSFFLWNAAPDDAVLKAAESGEILTPKGRTRVVDMMLSNPRLEAGVRAFFDDMFGFDGFAAITKDATVYPFFTGITALDAREQTLRTVVDHLITRKQDYRDLYTTRHTFLSPSLGALYQVRASSWMPYDLPEDSPRAGILTQISFLSLHAHPGRSSPTLRGKALRELLLCQPVPRPPANVDFSAVNNPNPNIRTQRERVMGHLENPVCAGCHKITDPMGLALENFDGAGQYRETERGAPIDASGTLDGKAFTNAVGLGQAMHDHPALTSCVVKRAYGYALGSPISREDQATLAYFNDRFAASGHRFPDLLRAIALSSAFSSVRETPASVASASSP